AFDDRIPEQHRSAHRAESALDLLRRAIPPHFVLAVDRQVLALYIHGGEKVARLLAALRAVAGFGLALQLACDLERDAAAQARRFHHGVFLPSAWSARMSVIARLSGVGTPFCLPSSTTPPESQRTSSGLPRSRSWC